MGNACTTCSACKGDEGENGEILTVDNKVSLSQIQTISNIFFSFKLSMFSFLFYNINLDFRIL